MRAVLFVLFIALFFSVSPCFRAQATEGAPEAGPAGRLRSAGSDTMRVLLESWTRAYAARRPGVAADIRSQGSSTGARAFLEGQCELAAMSREMTPEELSRFEKKFGRRPVDLHTALDALAVFTHPSNPVRGLTLGQLDGIFSSTHLCGSDDITRWDQLFLGPAKHPEIKTYGRNDLSGSRAFFCKKALCGGSHRESVKELPDSRSVERAVASDPAGIGYAGLGYRTKDVRVLALARNEDDGFYKYYVDEYRESDDPEKRFAWVYRGDYPLSRTLHLYVNKPEGEALPPHVHGFLRFVLSDEGQKIVLDEGFIPLTPDMAAKELDKLAPDYAPSKGLF